MSGPEAATADLSKYSKVLFVATAGDRCNAGDVLADAMTLVQAVAKLGRNGPDVCFVTTLVQSTTAGDMQGAPVPLHAGLWGLARTVRNEHPEVKLYSVDLDMQVRSVTNSEEHVACTTSSGKDVGIQCGACCCFPNLVGVCTCVARQMQDPFSRRRCRCCLGNLQVSCFPLQLVILFRVRCTAMQKLKLDSTGYG